MFELIGGRFFIRESDAALLELENAVIGDSHAKDVRSEIFESGEAAADGLRVDHPILPPHDRINCCEQFGLFQLIAKLGAEDFGESFHRDEKVWARELPGTIVT